MEDKYKIVLIKNTTVDQRKQIVSTLLAQATENGKNVPPKIVMDLLQEYIDGKTEILKVIKILEEKGI